MAKNQATKYYAIAARVRGKNYSKVQGFIAQAFVRWGYIQTYTGESYTEPLLVSAADVTSIDDCDLLGQIVTLRTGFDGIAELQRVAAAFNQHYTEHEYAVVQVKHLPEHTSDNS